MFGVGSNNRATRPPTRLPSLMFLPPAGPTASMKSGVVRAVADRAQGSGVTERNVDGALQVIADIAFVDRVDVGFDRSFGRAELGWFVM